MSEKEKRKTEVGPARSCREMEMMIERRDSSNRPRPTGKDGTQGTTVKKVNEPSSCHIVLCSRDGKGVSRRQWSEVNLIV